METRQQILDAFHFRFACKEFDPQRKISEQDFTVILEAARLSPSSFGFEPWKFIVLQNMELREKILPVCWGAQKQLKTASHFIVILGRKAPDLHPKAEYIQSIMGNLQKSPSDVIEARVGRLKNFQEKDFLLPNERALFDWASKQTYIALGNMMTAAALLGIDSCPIEGFNRESVEKILIEAGVFDPSHFGVSCLAAFGYRAAPPTRPKTRRAAEEVIEWKL